MTRPHPRRRSRRVLASLLVAAVVVTIVAAGARVRAQAELTAARTDLTAARGDAAGATDALRAAQQQVDDVAARRDADQAHADHVTATLLDLLQVHDDLTQVQASLSATQDQVAGTVSQIQVVASCLDALEAARTRVEAGDPTGARSALQAGTAPCEQATSIADGSARTTFPFDFADPYVLFDGGRYYAFGTNGAAGQVQVLTSTDEQHWQIAGNALPAMPGWAQPGQTWAPAVLRTANGLYVLYYTVRERDSGKQCISSAVSSAPAGPYLDLSPFPLICQVESGGSIDASPYVDDNGTSYLVWKSEDETQHRPSQLWAQQTSPDGGSLVGDPVVLASADQSWEHGVVEGPSMASIGGTWTLLYSGNSWATGDYAVGYARCDGPLGPCTKPAQNVLLHSGGVMAGPGGAEFFVDGNGRLSVAFAAWDSDHIGYPNPRRLHVGTVVGGGGTPPVIQPQ